MSGTLLPCPFCGKQPKSSCGVVGPWYIACECGCAIVTGHGERDCIPKWNRRAPTQPEVETVGWQDLRNNLGRWFAMRHDTPPHKWVEAERLVKESAVKLWPDLLSTQSPQPKEEQSHE